MFVQAYINTATEILKTYDGKEPLSSFLKKFFKANKKFGSRDRKQIAHLCYCFFRLGKSLGNYSIEERLAVALFLCDQSPSRVLEHLNAEWNKKVSKPLVEKISFVQQRYAFDSETIFPFTQNLSNEIKFDSFAKSFLIQPDIYLRIRPGKEQIVQEKLSSANIPFQTKNPNCLSVAPATKLEEILSLNKEAVIQDFNSQKVLERLLAEVSSNKTIKTAWDCCAASGGKSILLFDYFPAIQLTVSDVRESILFNLSKRFSEAGISHYKKIVADLSAGPLPLDKKFDLVVCDAPCSGSGTWARTPEQLYFFDEKKIEHYSALQKRIVTNAVKNLKPGSYFLYITCSVFKKENEEIVSFIEEDLSISLLGKKYFSGYQAKADTLFTAVFKA